MPDNDRSIQAGLERSKDCDSPETESDKKPARTPPKNPETTGEWIFTIVVTLILLTPIYFFFSWVAAPRAASQSSLTRNACRNYGRAIANYPDTASFGFGELTDDDRRWESTMTARNAFNVPSTTSFVCWADSSGRVTSFTTN